MTSVPAGLLLTSWQCDEGICCKHCRKAFPRHPEVCVREKLSDVRFPDDGQGGELEPPHRLSPVVTAAKMRCLADIWSRESARLSLLQQNWQLVGAPYQVVVKKNPSSDSPGLPLMLQPYVVNARPSAPAAGYYSSPAAAGISSAQVASLSTWAGTQFAPNPAVWDCLAPGQERLSRDLLAWAERQLARELYEKKAPDFEAAILSFLFAYRESSLDLHGASSSSGKKKLPACVDPKNLVRKVCELRCWYLIWQSSKLYTCAHGGVPYANGPAHSYSQLQPTVIWELRKIATEALVACEKEVLLELDELSPDGARLIELPLWACIWQMILIYRQLVSGYSNLARNQPASSVNGGSTGEWRTFLLVLLRILGQ